MWIDKVAANPAPEAAQFKKIAESDKARVEQLKKKAE
jgi:hypothetical protein